MSFNLPSNVGPTLNQESVIIYMRSFCTVWSGFGRRGEAGFNHLSPNLYSFPLLSAAFFPLCPNHHGEDKESLSKHQARSEGASLWRSWGFKHSQGVKGWDPCKLPSRLRASASLLLWLETDSLRSGTHIVPDFSWEAGDGWIWLMRRSEGWDYSPKPCLQRSHN